MVKTGLNTTSERFFYEETLLTKEHERAPTGLALGKTRNDFAKHVRDVGKSEGFDEMITLERRFLEIDLAKYITSSAQGTSIKTSLSELDAAEKARTLVDAPEQYAAVDASHGHTKARSGSLPKDDMRLFLSSQNSRLLNMDKSKLSEPEKKIIAARRDNIREAQTIYIAMQRQALGIAVKPSKDRAQDLER